MYRNNPSNPLSPTKWLSCTPGFSSLVMVLMGDVQVKSCPCLFFPKWEQNLLIEFTATLSRSIFAFKSSATFTPPLSSLAAFTTLNYRALCWPFVRKKSDLLRLWSLWWQSRIGRISSLACEKPLFNLTPFLCFALFQDVGHISTQNKHLL